MVKHCVCRYTFFFQLPILPELFVSSYDFAGFGQMLRGDKGSSSPITNDDIEAFKYTFGKSGNQSPPHAIGDDPNCCFATGALTAPINYYRCNMWKGETSRKNKKMALGEDTPPGLLIFGAEDKYLHADFVPMSAALVKNLQTEVVAGGNHFVQQDEPTAVNLAMRTFLAQTAD